MVDMAVNKEVRKSTRYREIATELQKEIRLGATPVGELLPTETELMARFGAGRQTVREALRIITEQGLIVRRAGLGSVVIATEPPVLFTHSVKSLNEWLRYSNETYRRVVGSSEIVADRKLAGLLKCEPGPHPSSLREATLSHKGRGEEACIDRQIDPPPMFATEQREGWIAWRANKKLSNATCW